MRLLFGLRDSSALNAQGHAPKQEVDAPDVYV
jgi:hypothetical protein